jgi:hypothetical protein
MGCQSSVVLGNNLTFSVTTHDPDTGVLTDADAVPTYRVYEDDTATAILTGDMALLDTGNTTGFYAKKIACTAANGFEYGKSYTVYIEATVDSDKCGIAYDFMVESAYASAGAGAITWTYTVTDASTGVPIGGVDVWVTTDIAGVNVIASGVTDSSGVVTFTLDAGTVYVWRSRSGYNFTNPDTEVVS